MTTDERLNAIEHEFMINEELINRDDVITLIARKHLSKEEDFHRAITRLNRQVKALKTITIKAELTKILEKISVDTRPNIRGHWKVFSDRYGENAYICECSECKDTVWVYKDADRKWNFCPNCGADMRGDATE